LITSTKNARVKRIVRLRRRSERDASRRFLVEGARELGRAIEAGVEFDDLVWCRALLRPPSEAIVAEANARGTALLEVAENVFRAVSQREGPDGVLGVARSFDVSLDNLVTDDDSLVLVAAEIEKPGNLGAMLRSAAAAGVTCLVVADPVSDIFNPNVVRSSLGALFTVPIGVATAGEALDWVRERRLGLVATSPGASMPFWEASLVDRSAIVIGSEDVGLSRAWLEAADQSVIVPMGGGPGVDSLNAASTAAILLFEAVRQRAAARV
jgi:TrmH family RNA methyltransferase